MSLSVTTKLDRIAAGYAAKSKVSELSLAISQPSTGLSWDHGNTAQPYFIASITKLYTVSMIMQLRDAGEFTLDTRVADLLGGETMRGLNVHGGRDHGPAVTVRELLTQTSGIPDYFAQKRADGTTFLAEILRTDGAWTFDDYLEMARAMPSRFAPSTPGKAQYCDTNYQLLGRVIEVVTAGSFDQAIRDRILAPLGLRDTWLFTPDTVDRYGEVATIFHGRDPLRIPKAIASFAPDGAVVSTAADQLRFLCAFNEGRLFPARYLTEMTAHWKPVFSPLDPIDYGIGIMRFKLPRWQSIPRPPELIGHSGAFGSVLYRVRDRDIYVSGTVNQMRPRSLPYPLLLRLIAALR